MLQFEMIRAFKFANSGIVQVTCKVPVLCISYHSLYDNFETDNN